MTEKKKQPNILYVEPESYMTKEAMDILNGKKTTKKSKNKTVSNKNKSSIVKAILRRDFHAANFDVEGIHYTFSGWWLLDMGDNGNKVYESKEEFLNDPIFGGKTLPEVNAQNIEVEYES